MTSDLSFEWYKRCDEEFVNDRWTIAYGLRLPWAHPIWDEYLLIAYDLIVRPGDTDHPVVYKPGMNYELMFYALAPDVKIDWKTSMYKQKGLQPLEPANYGFQFYAATQQEADARIEDLVMSLCAGIMSPEDDDRRAWKRMFKDGQSLRQSDVMDEANRSTKH